MWEGYTEEGGQVDEEHALQARANDVVLLGEDQTFQTAHHEENHHSRCQALVRRADAYDA